MSSRQSGSQLPYPPGNNSNPENQRLLDDIASRVVFGNLPHDSGSPSEARPTEGVLHLAGSEEPEYEYEPESMTQADPSGTSTERETEQEQDPRGQDDQSSHAAPMTHGGPPDSITPVAQTDPAEMELDTSETGNPTFLGRSEGPATAENSVAQDPLGENGQGESSQVAQLRQQLAQERNAAAAEIQEWEQKWARAKTAWFNRDRAFTAAQAAWTQHEQQLAAEKEAWESEKANARAHWDGIGRRVNAERNALRQELATARRDAATANAARAHMQQQIDEQNRINVLLPPFPAWPHPEQDAPSGHHWALEWTVRPNPSPIGHGMQLAHSVPPRPAVPDLSHARAGQPVDRVPQPLGNVQGFSRGMREAQAPSGSRPYRNQGSDEQNLIVSDEQAAAERAEGEEEEEEEGDESSDDLSYADQDDSDDSMPPPPPPSQQPPASGSASSPARNTRSSRRQSTSNANAAQGSTSQGPANTPVRTGPVTFPSFPGQETPLPAGLLYEEIIDNYPNHLRGAVIMDLWEFSGYTFTEISNRMALRNNIMSSGTLWRRIQIALRNAGRDPATEKDRIVQPRTAIRQQRGIADFRSIPLQIRPSTSASASQG